MNLVQASRINPAISAYNQIYGIFDFNPTPLAILGMRVCVHDRSLINGSWADKGIEGFYVGPAPNHYKNYTYYMPKTRAFQTSDNVEFSHMIATCQKHPAPIGLL